MCKQFINYDALELASLLDPENYFASVRLYGEEAQALANKIAENVSTRRKPIIHELKILQEYFNEVQSHNKQFELCKDDRDYRVGDWILLKEFENGSYTGRECG